MKFISGRNPDLFLYSDNGDLIETIDLSPYSTEEIHNLLAQKGFVRKPQPPQPQDDDETEF